MTTKINAEDIEVREFGTGDYRVQIKRPLSRECYEIKQSIINNDEIVSRIRKELSRPVRVSGHFHNSLFSFNRNCKLCLEEKMRDNTESEIKKLLKSILDMKKKE